MVNLLGLLNEDSKLMPFRQELLYHLSEYRKQRNDSHFRYILNKFDFFNANAVLDMGCGIGQTLWILGNGPQDKIGIDIDKFALRIGDQISKSRGDTILFACSSGDNLPFPDNLFSHIICRVTLNYVHQFNTLREFDRILKSNGILYLRAETIGFDINLVKRSISLRELFARLNDFTYATYHNITGKQLAGLPFNRVGRMYSSRDRLTKYLKRLNLYIIHFRTFGKALLSPCAMEIVAQKRIRNSGVTGEIGK